MISCCNSCGKDKELKEFPMDADLPTSWEICKECAIKENLEWDSNE